MRLTLKTTLSLFACTALSSLSARELTSPSTLAEFLLSSQYEKLHSSLDQDLDLLVQQEKTGDPLDPTQGETRLRLLLHATLEKLPRKEISTTKWNDAHDGFLKWLFADPELLAMLLSELRSEDDAAQVLSTWAKIWYHENDSDLQTQYAPLALALALIYDRPGAVRRGAEESQFPTLSYIERYEYFRDASEGGKLSTPCHRLSVRDLVRIVDLNISKAEIDWVQRHVSGSAKKCGAQYDDIEYLMERAVNNVNPYENYILSEIKKHGGICGDQAHYSASTAKARGIPAVTVVGTGDRGPHAWLAFMPERNEWDTHGSQGITNGKAYCTQRGKRISARLVELESLDHYEPKKREPALLHVQLAKRAIAKGELSIAKSHLASAKKLAKSNLEIWQAEEQLLIASKASADQWTTYFRGLEKTYDEYSNVLEWALKLKIKHLFAKMPEEDRMKLLDREIRSVARDLGSKESALITVVDRVAALLAEQQAQEAIRGLYRKCFRRYGEDLELFTKLIDSYVQQGSKIPDLKPLIPGDLHKAYKRNVESSTKEFFRAKMELSVLSRVLSVYNRLGDEGDAATIKKIKKDIASRRKKIDRAAL